MKRTFITQPNARGAPSATRALGASMLLLAVVAPQVFAASVTPIIVDGNPTCESQGYAFGFKPQPEPPPTGTYTFPDGINTITISSDGKYFDWTSTIPLDAVIVKGGQKANLYKYDPPSEASEDTGLVSPNNASGEPAGISHIEVCYDYELAASKSADTSYTRTYTWSITKTATPQSHTGQPGDVMKSDYTVTVEQGVTDSDFKVSGTINVRNPTPYSVTFQVEDKIGSNSATVNCPTYTLGAWDSVGVDCNYSVSLSEKEDGKNTATITTPNDARVGDSTAERNYAFGEPTQTIGIPVTIEDYAEIFDSEGKLIKTESTTLGEITGEISDKEEFKYSVTNTKPCGSTILEYWATEKRINTASISGTEAHATEEVTWQCELPPNAALTVTKTAATAWDRVWDWTIKKSADQKSLTLSLGQPFIVNYDVTVTPAKEDLFKVSGQVNIQNDAAEPASITSVSDLMSPGDIVIALTCSGSGELPGYDTRTCSYERALTAGEATAAGLPPAGGSTVLTNVATAATYDTFWGVQTFTGEASATFTVPGTEADKCVEVTDNRLDAPLASQYCAESVAKVFEYPVQIGPYEECGTYTVPNVASLKTDDDKELTAEWTINVEVPCLGGCTLTPGYWKTHSQKGPAPYDDTWAALCVTPDGGTEICGADAPFFKSDHSYYQVLWTPPKGGNAYYILAHAYIAAELNFLNGADKSTVQAAFKEATDLFGTYTPADVATLKGKAGNDLRANFIRLAGILDGYNNGLTGPGHCSEDATSAPAGQ